MSSNPRLDRAVAAFECLAVGDALGLPAEYHRTAREPWLRGALWSGTIALDEERVSRPLVPFGLTLDTGTMTGTDDIESLALAARVMAGADLGIDALFDRWRELFDADEWAGPAERIAATNAARGLRPPVTGTDNPARGDDSAVPAAVAAGVRFAGDPTGAAALAAAYAGIAHADDGVWAPAVMAAAIAALVDGGDLDDALSFARSLAPTGSWLDASFDAVEPVAGAGGPAFARLPALLAALGTRDYSHPALAARTVPAAFAIIRSTGGRLAEALPLALSVSRLSDSLPALVGALAGASGERIPPGWDADWRGGTLGDLGTVGGVLQPQLRGLVLSDLARALIFPK
ncbi:ADP-ribosylglycohydrolase family protein [Amnibacterium flavum]|uniref:ADP-ribosylglycohydrolase family protein n=1 Tax=Amnibacterium flavum TaxID=2173173 RepID=A0A2V1HLR4_9MICO|nr:ADP-ribosylglycohydrolase family protein [Amnibacterium flavum]PVZ93395.1 hypothetical protein DDQ50_15590 [Amnibacterium flavum]